MTAVETAGRFTRADLDAMPDDGRRYELLDGAIIVSAAPGPRHQIAAFSLAQLLDAALPMNPRLRVWTLRDGEYVEIADVAGAEAWTAEAPYAVTVRPADLVR